MADGLIAGRLLVASPMLGDPNFRRTVVLMISHTAEGALGVVLNRPSQQRVGEAVPGWEQLTSEPGVVFSGGPVEPERVLALGRSLDAEASSSWTAVLGRVGMVDLDAKPAALAQTVSAVRLFSGYAGWGAGQLESELGEGAWFVLDALEEDPLTDAPQDLWRRVFRRQRDDLMWFAFYPDDPTLN